MNIEDAKLILASVHQDALPDVDAEHALAMLDTDPDLKSWFESEQAFDRAISSKLAEIEPPAELKSTLINLLNDSEASGASPDSPRNVTWFRSPFLAAAAAIILVPLVAIQMFTGKANAKSFDSFREDMVELASGEFELDHMHNELPELYSWLNANNATCPTDIPECVDFKESVGCKVIDWDEDSVTLICLRTSTNDVVHCFVIPRSELKKIPAEEKIRSKFEVKHLETAGWTDQNNLYLLVGSAKGVHVSAPKQ